MAHGVRGADQIAQRILAADFLAQDAVLALDVQFFDGAFEQQAQHVGINRLYEVVVTAGVNYFQRRVFGLVRAEHDHQGVNVTSGEAAEKFGAFAQAAGFHGESEQQNVQTSFLKQFVSGFVILALHHVKSGAQRRDDACAHPRVIIHNRNF